MKQNNSGLTLVELITAIAILAVASLAIMSFIQVASRHYEKENREVDLQYEAQLAANQITNLVVNTSKGITYQYDVGGAETQLEQDGEILSPEASNLSKSLILYADSTYYVLTFRRQDQKIYYDEYQQNGILFDRVEHEEVFAAHVEDLSFDLSAAKDQHTILMTLRLQNGQTLEIKQTIALRNTVLINEPLDVVYASERVS